MKKGNVLGLMFVISVILFGALAFALGGHNQSGFERMINFTGDDAGDIYVHDLVIYNELHFKSMSSRPTCDQTTNGVIIYEIDGNDEGVHYACRQLDIGSWDWEALY